MLLNPRKVETTRKSIKALSIHCDESAASALWLIHPTSLFSCCETFLAPPPAGSSRLPFVYDKLPQKAASEPFDGDKRQTF
jgi:hypothetical protein